MNSDVGVFGMFDVDNQAVSTFMSHLEVVQGEACASVVEGSALNDRH